MWFVLLLCMVASLADIIGGALTVFKKLNANEALLVTGLGAGLLLGATVLDRLPDSMAQLPNTAPDFIILGYLLLLFLERVGTHQHAERANSRVETPLYTHGHAVHAVASMESQAATVVNPRTAWISFVGLLLHTFMDGVIISGAFSISRATGILIFFAIAMHKIPEGFSMASISLAAGTSRRRAFFVSCGLAVSTMIGALVTMSLGSVHTDVVKVLMALATGTFLFVSTTDMVPAIKDHSYRAMFCIIMGVALFYVSLLFIKHVGLS